MADSVLLVFQFCCGAVLQSACCQNWPIKCARKIYFGEKRENTTCITLALTCKKKTVFVLCQMILAKERFPSYFQRPNAHYLPACLVCDKESLFTDAVHFVCVRQAVRFFFFRF